MNREIDPECGSGHRSWFRIAALICLGMISVTVFVVACIQIKDLRQLKDAARRIQIGDSPKEVHSLLGEPKLGYEGGWPSPGAPPTEYGEMYGGRLDYLRDDLESSVPRNLKEISPYWFSRSLRSWPVRIQYNGSKRVNAVYIDCIKVK